jgi:hypothetical protein
MRAPAVGLLLASTLALGLGALPAQAQFGLPVPLPNVRNIPLPVPGPGRHLHRGVLPGVVFHRHRRTFGIIGAVAVGTIILGTLSRRDALEVTRRTRIVLDRDPDVEVVEQYDTRDGNRRVVITAGPSQKVSDIKDDPALKQTSETVEQAGGSAGATGKKGAKKDADKKDVDVVKVDDLAPDAPCRKVTTEMQSKAGKKKNDSEGDAKTSNTSILCQGSGGEWKPASG